MPRPKEQINLDLSPRQGEAYNDSAQFLLYGGAKGGGKSWFLCVWIFTQAMQKRGNKLFFFRKRAVDFNNTTLETWKKVVPARYYEINPTLKKITIPNSGSVIDYGGLDDEQTVEKLNSAEYGGGAIDQAEEIEKDSFAMCRGTLRHTLPDGSKPSYQVRLSANPRQCWLKNDFVVSPRKGHKFITALPVDNPYLPEFYVDNLKEAFEHRPEKLKAYLYGSWDELAGSNVVCQVSWVEDAKKRMAYGPTNKIVVVCDPSRFGDDETVIYVMRQRDKIEVIDEEILSHKTLMDTTGRLIGKKRKWGAQAIAVDGIGIGAGIVDALNEQGEDVIDIVSSQKPTIQTAQIHYINMRAQMWMEGAKEIHEGHVVVPPDDILAGQLSTPTYDFASNGRIKVEAKDEIKKRLGRSPDRGDCFIMGIHALAQLPSKREQAYIDSGTDRVGHGTPIEVEELEYTPFP